MVHGNSCATGGTSPIAIFRPQTTTEQTEQTEQTELILRHHLDIRPNARYNARLCSDPTVFRPNRILTQLSIGACHTLSSATLLGEAWLREGK